MVGMEGGEIKWKLTPRGWEPNYHMKDTTANLMADANVFKAGAHIYVDRIGHLIQLTIVGFTGTAGGDLYFPAGTVPVEARPSDVRVCPTTGIINGLPQHWLIYVFPTGYIGFHFVDADGNVQKATSVGAGATLPTTTFSYVL